MELPCLSEKDLYILARYKFCVTEGIDPKITDNESTIIAKAELHTDICDVCLEKFGEIFKGFQKEEYDPKYKRPKQK